MNSKKKINTKDIVCIALFAAVMSVLSQLSLPLPGGVPVTLQTFGAALVGYMLGAKRGAASMTVYVLLGAVGMPVFAGLHGGLASVTGQLGGFIWGFIPMAFLCGMGSELGKRFFSSSKIAEGFALAFVLGLMGLAACHICGIIQWSAIRGGGFWGSFLTASAPFLLKDSISVAAAYPLCEAVKKRLNFNRHSSAHA